ncbi:hypothetical protein OFR20_00235 [Brachyspira hyodysenteriae]|uniref:hypothetical protein n=1 Tax=Brachyspira hyodysenteriae TaxID=159 RepID=UPI0022CD458F|nr:hypothetical protein [Brachyspira hyodysenteriae]MCZ9979963.1 hypothetical protein [Brachyspira hyodysenteriae]
MKNRVFLTIILIFVIAFNLQAVNLSIGIISQFGMSGANTNASKIFPSGFRDFDTGFLFSIGANQPISSSMSFSVLLDLGYYYDSYDFKYIIDGNRVTENYQFNSFLIGGYVRFNFGFLSLGAGGGAKIPGSATYRISGYEMVGRYRFSFGDLSDIFESAIIPYLRFSIDFSIFNYLLIGVYANYDFPLYFQHNNYMSDVLVNKDSISAFDIGIQFGYYLNINFDRNYY